MVNTDVLKTTVEDDLKEIAKRKLDILILQRQNETLCKENNEKIKEFADEITNRELSLEDNLSKSGERKIETPAGYCAYRAMPDKWEYDDKEIIRYCKLNAPHFPYYKTVETVNKADLKKAITDKRIAPIPGITVISQAPKFSYKLNGGL